MSDEPRKIESLRLAGQPSQVFPVGTPRPREAGEDRFARDVLDGFHHLGKELFLALADRGERHSAVAENHRSDAVPARRCSERVPTHLRIEMGVDVDESGRDQSTRCVKRSFRCSEVLAVGTVADRHDGVTIDRHIGSSRFIPRTIDDKSPADHQIMHGLTVPAGDEL